MNDQDTGLKAYHGRGFPGRSFIPSSVRLIPPRRIEVAFLNSILGVNPHEYKAPQVMKMVLDRAVDGDPNEIESIKSLLENVWFTPNRGGMGKGGVELLVSHISIGRYYRPKEHYNVDIWVPTILKHGGLLDDEESMKRLKRAYEAAEKRPQNLVEKCICSTLSDGDREHRGYEPAEKMAMLPVIQSIGRLIKLTLNQLDWKKDDNTEAERISLDVLALMRTGFFVIYTLSHLNALDHIRSYENNEEPAPVRKLYFGFSSELDVSLSRRFQTTRKTLDEDLEQGYYAIVALSRAHELFDWEEALWFDEVPDQRLSPSQSQKMEKWVNSYIRALQNAGLENPKNANGRPGTYREAIVMIADLLGSNNRLLNPADKQRAGYNYTVALLSAMAMGDDGNLFKNLGKGAGRGVKPMVDSELILLVSRALMTHSRRASLMQVRQELEKWGVLLDHQSYEAVINELEKSGHIQKLSDSGESIYVRID